MTDVQVAVMFEVDPRVVVHINHAHKLHEPVRICDSATAITMAMVKVAGLVIRISRKFDRVNQLPIHICTPNTSTHYRCYSPTGVRCQHPYDPTIEASESSGIFRYLS